MLITGAGGFVGKRLCAALKLREPSWTIYTPPAALASTSPEQLDVSDSAAVGDWVRAHKPDIVIHLAAVAAVTTSVKDPRTAWTVNLNGTLNIVLALEEFAPQAHLLYVSSAEVYGCSFRSGLSLDETALLQPVNPYAASKAAADILVRQAAGSGLSATVMRPFNHTGPGQAEAFVVSSFAGQIARIEAGLQPPVLAVGTLEDERDFLDVEDVVDAYVLALQQRGLAAGEVFNVASGKSVKIGDILDRLLAQSDVRIEVIIDAERLRRAPVPRVIGNANHLRHTLGWEQKISLDQTLRSVLDYHRAYCGSVTAQ